MESHLSTRPKKTPFSLAEQQRLRTLAIENIHTQFMPNEEILKIFLIGSSVKGTFGAYEAPGFRGSLFSDFDFIFFVKDLYTIPERLEREPYGKPFADDALNLAYRQKNFVEETYDAELFFIRESSLQQETFRIAAESAGIPLDEESSHPHLIIYQAT